MEEDACAENFDDIVDAACWGEAPPVPGCEVIEIIWKDFDMSWSDSNSEGSGSGSGEGSGDEYGVDPYGEEDWGSDAYGAYAQKESSESGATTSECDSDDS